LRTSRYKYAVVSFSALGLAVLMLLVGTLAFDSTLSGLSLTAQRWVTFFALVVPPIIGGAAAVIGLVSKERSKLLLALGLVLNSAFGLFFVGVLLIAG